MNPDREQNGTGLRMAGQEFPEANYLLETKQKILSQGLEFIPKPASPAALLRKVILDKE